MAATPAATMGTREHPSPEPLRPMLQRRRPRVMAADDEEQPLLGVRPRPAGRLSSYANADIVTADDDKSEITISSSPSLPPGVGGAAMYWGQSTTWLPLAIASGACAACNGVFAKLTTTELTSKFADAVTGILWGSGQETPRQVIEIGMRVVFFVLNLVFNGIMWALFTTALARASSTTRVSIINTSANFMITALLGLMIFAENLPPLWWLGASLLVAGSVIIGRRVEGGLEAGTPSSPMKASDASPIDLESGSSVESDTLLSDDLDLELDRELKEGEDVDAPLE
ncbi:MAG: hypothetical protein M1838_001035 [Thelocarpon superellum]|nr:MAG: hypothetical protein M1838_001035 [Thelocarpon superellum]